MKFSVGFWDSLFGEKCEIEVPNNGDTMKRTVTKKWLKLMQQQGKISPLITAYVLDPIYLTSNPEDPVYSEDWEIGKDISRESYEKYKWSDGGIYILNVYEEGNLNQLILKREMWVETKRKMEEL